MKKLTYVTLILLLSLLVVLNLLAQPVESLQKTEAMERISPLSRMAVDKNSLWIGRYMDGKVEKHNKRTKKMTEFVIEPMKGKHPKSVPLGISAIAIDRENVWIGTFSDGIRVYNKKTDKWTNYIGVRKLAENEIRCIAVDNDYVWIGTYRGGIRRFDKKTDKFTSSIYYPNKVGHYLHPLREPRNSVFALAVDDNYIWYGGHQGLVRYNKKTNGFATYTTSNGLTGNYINFNALVADQDYVWVGTAAMQRNKYGRSAGIKGTGLCRYNKKTGKWVTYTIENGLASNDVNCITIDGNYVWVGTKDNAKISRYDKKRDDWHIFTLYDGRDAIETIAIEDNYIWVITLMNKFFRFDKKIEVNKLFRFDKKTDKWANLTNHILNAPKGL